jgi:hypothetical protein
MRQKFSTPMRVVLAAATACILVASAPQAADIEVKNPVPSTYTVTKGDTLWGIASRFLKDPWRWPDIWRMNRDAIKNPHRIYPGDVIALDRGADGQWQLRVAQPIVRLSPTVRVEQLDAEAIPSIPPGDIEPYLSRPLITGPEGLVNSGEIVAGRDARVVRGNNDQVYATGLDPKAGDRLYIYRPGRTLKSLDTGEVLGYEQRFIGSARVERFADVSTVRISTAKEEVLVGDRLVPTPPEQIVNFAPHAPDKPVYARIIATGRDSVEVGSGWIVTLDKGARDGIDVGMVLAVYRVVPPIPDPKPTKEPDRIDYLLGATRFLQADPNVLQVPDERSGLMFVFRVFDRVSYALIVSTTDPIDVGDHARKP